MIPLSTALDLPAIAERYFAAWAAHDPDAIIALHTPDSQFQAHGRGAAVHGREALREEFVQVFERYPSFDFEAHRVLYGEKHWVLDWTLTFQPPGQDRRGFHCLDVVEVAGDGRVARKDTFFDFAELKAAFASMTSAETARQLIDRTPLDALPVEHLCDLSVDIEPALVIPTPLGTRMTFITKGGRLEGRRLRGELLPGGGDWISVGTDGISRIDVRGTIRTDDGVLIHYESRGIVKLPADGRSRLARGERLAFEETYVRTTPKFETADPRYAWLNDLVIVGHNELSPGHIDYRMYRIL